MASSKRLQSSHMYTVGWIAALDKELAAAMAVLDERHQKPEGFKKHPKDTNSYTWGRIGEHNIAIACLAAGRYGSVSAAITAMQMISSLPHLRFGLMVGIGAGIPRLEEGIDIRLGDVIVSHPTGTSPGVVQYDLAKLKASGQVERVGSLDSPPEVLLKGLATLRANHLMEDSRVPEILEKMIKDYPRMGENDPDGFIYQGAHNDRLFETPLGCYQDSSSASLYPAKEMEREPRSSNKPKIHYGTIASGNSVIKDGVSRDKILQRLNDKCICFEMEAAGLMNNFPCLVIRGVCDYADEHKNDGWQKYAAATAAAFSKELLEVMDGEDIERTSPIEEIVRDLGYQITEMISAQKEARNMRESQNKQDHLRKRHEWLSPPDASTNYTKALRKRHQDSGNWFLRSSEYSAWKTNRNSLLWLHGIPGCGKTVLSSTIIQDLMGALSNSEGPVATPTCNIKERGQKRANDDEAFAQVPSKKPKKDHGKATDLSRPQMSPAPQSAPADICLYFYFDFTDNRKQTLENTLRSLISQLCGKRTDLDTDVDLLYSSCDHGNRQPTVELLRKTFQSMVEKAGKVWIVLDALDECQTRDGDPDEGLLGWIGSLIIPQEVNVHFLVTSRLEQDIRSAFEDLTLKKDPIVTIPIPKDVVERDILDYVHTTVRQSQNLRRWDSRPGIQNEIETTLTKKANGMFRWVSCQLDVLEKCISPKALRRALQSLPETLEETYRRIMTNIPDHHRNDTTRMLQFLTFSPRPLRIEEVIDAVAVDLDQEPPFDPENRIPVPMDILRCCSSLVTFFEDTHEIHLAHFSVKEFITSEADKGVFTHPLDARTAHESIIEVIVAYLSILTVPDIDEKSIAELRKSYHLANYCARHWVDHARPLENNENVRERLLELFSNEEAWLICNQIFHVDSQWDYSWDLNDYTDAPEPLYVASVNGLNCIVEDLLQQGANIDAEGGYWGTALQAACILGHSDTAKILIEHGPNMDLVGGWDFYSPMTALVSAIDNNLIDVACLLVKRGANPHIQGSFFDDVELDMSEIYPIHLACIRGAVEVIEALIDNSADINLVTRWGHSPLQIACSEGHEKVVKLLLERGADAHQRNEWGETLLHSAAHTDNKDVFRLLFEKRVNVNVQDTHGCTPLHTVAEIADKDIAQLLLEQGADIHVQDGNGQTPLHAAAAEVYSRQIVQLLLEHGATVHAQDNEGRTPLHAAVAVRYFDMVTVQLLLEHGADAHLRDSRGRTPLGIAERQGREQIAQLLQTPEGAALPSSVRAQEDAT